MVRQYDRRAAAAYALKYAIKYNPAWPSYVGAGGDCTNFVSQALYAGGWTMIWPRPRTVSADEWDTRAYYVSKDPRVWYANRDYPKALSWTWSNAGSFNQFLMKNTHRAQSCAREDLGLGDVVQLFDYNLIHHTVIATGILPTTIKRTNVAFVTYHTYDVQQTVLDHIADKTGT